MIEIRKAKSNDLSSILIIYSKARAFMKKSGNPDQWGETYPDEETVNEDIRKERLYVVEENNSLLAVFVCTTEEESAYNSDECTWHSRPPYAVIHRVASSGERKGMTKLIFDFALTQADAIRIDTHIDNIPMQKALLRYGFLPSGTVYYSRCGKKTSRIAFDYVAKENNN